MSKDNESEFTTSNLTPTEFKTLRLDREGFELGSCTLTTHNQKPTTKQIEGWSQQWSNEVKLPKPKDNE